METLLLGAWVTRQILFWTIVQGLVFGLRRFGQHMSGHIAGITRVADAQSQAQKTAFIAQALDDRAQAIVAAMTTTDLQARGARRQVKLVMYYQNIAGR